MSDLGKPLIRVAWLLIYGSGVASAQDTPPEILAAQLRLQRHRCDTPVTAQRDTQLSKPDEAAWILTCANTSYRVRFVPDVAARTEQLDRPSTT